jgi:hypothetical protein
MLCTFLKIIYHKSNFCSDKYIFSSMVVFSTQVFLNVSLISVLWKRVAHGKKGIKPRSRLSCCLQCCISIVTFFLMHWDTHPTPLGMLSWTMVLVPYMFPSSSRVFRALTPCSFLHGNVRYFKSRYILHLHNEVVHSFPAWTAWCI